MGKRAFLRGLGSILDLSGYLNDYDFLTGSDADARAIRGDWEAVGRDMWQAAEELERLEEQQRAKAG